MMSGTSAKCSPLSSLSTPAVVFTVLAFASTLPVSASECEKYDHNGEVLCTEGGSVKPVPETASLPTAPSTRNARLSYPEESRLKSELAMAVEKMVERYATDYPSDDYQPQVEVRGYAEIDTAQNIAHRLGTALHVSNVKTVIYLVESQDIIPTFERSENGTLVFTSSLESSANFRLQQAIEQRDIELVAQILAEESPDLERYGASLKLRRTTPLMQAVAANHVGIVNLLLRAGADPDTLGLLPATSPLFLAMYNGNKALVTMLGRAGADLNSRIRTGNQLSPVAYAISIKRLDLAALLIDLGADANVTDETGWSALMDALFAEQTFAVEKLIAVSNPLLISTEPIPRNHRTKHLDRRYFPQTNSLYIAWQMTSSKKNDIAAALIARARIIDPEWGEPLLRMQAGRSASRAAAFVGDIKEAIDRLREALAVEDVSKYTPEMNGEAIMFAMESLTELHELLLIDGRDLSTAERSQIAQIESIGGWHAKLHDMLDTIAEAQTSYPSKRLERWSELYGKPDNADWNFTRLNNWVESMNDESMRERLFDTLDFFELNWAVKRQFKGVIR